MSSKVRILDEKTTVIGPSKLPGLRNKVELKPGDPWNVPYRGSKYTITSLKDDKNVSWSRTGIKCNCTNISKDFIDKIMRYKNGLGSFLITPHKEIIARYQDEATGKWPAVYVGILEGKMEFDSFDLDPELEIGQLWTGFMFKHGESFSVWSRDRSDNFLHWKRLGIHFRTVDQYAKLCTLVREIRPKGGRLYLNEYGHIWMNVPFSIDLDVGHKWIPQIKQTISESRSHLSNNETLLSATYDRVETTKTFPIYLGKVDEYMKSELPRTYFKEPAVQFFLDGGEDPNDRYSYSRRERTVFN